MASHIFGLEEKLPQRNLLLDGVTKDLIEARDWMKRLHDSYPPQLFSTFHQHSLVFRLLYRRILAGVTLAASLSRLHNRDDRCALFESTFRSIASDILVTTKLNCCDEHSVNHFTSWIHPSVSELLRSILDEGITWDDRWRRSLTLLP